MDSESPNFGKKSVLAMIRQASYRSPSEVVVKRLATVRKILINVKNDPSNAKWRTLNLSKPKLVELIETPGVERFFFSLGFRRQHLDADAGSPIDARVRKGALRPYLVLEIEKYKVMDFETSLDALQAAPPSLPVATKIKLPSGDTVTACFDLDESISDAIDFIANVMGCSTEQIALVDRAGASVYESVTENVVKLANLTLYLERRLLVEETPLKRAERRAQELAAEREEELAERRRKNEETKELKKKSAQEKRNITKLRKTAVQRYKEDREARTERDERAIRNRELRRAREEEAERKRHELKQLNDSAVSLSQQSLVGSHDDDDDDDSSDF